MATYVFFSSNGFAGAKRQEEVEIDTDGLSDDDEKELVEEQFQAWLAITIDNGWYKKEG